MKIYDYITREQPAADQERRGSNPWVGVIIHHTDIGNRDPDTVQLSLWRTLFKNITDHLARKDAVYASAHFHISREGEIVQLVDPRTHVAYHAGISSWYHPIYRKVTSNWNSYSVGIELLGDGNGGDFSEAQYKACARLVKDLMKTFPTIDPRCITGHENIAPTRKRDPGKHFQWRKFFQLIHS